jgi:hypothetical protein
LRWWPLILVVAGVLVALRPVKTVQAPADKFVVSSAPQLRSPPNPAEKPAGKNKNQGKTSTTAAPIPPRGALGEYTQPAPGASVEILPDNE